MNVLGKALSTRTSGGFTSRRIMLGTVVSVALAACGGGTGVSDAQLKSSGTPSTADALDRGNPLFGKAAELNSRELVAAQAAVEAGGARPSFVTKALPTVPVFRFFNTRSGAHFYTSSAEERDLVSARLPQFVYEGVAFQVSDSPQAGLSPVYRFFNRRTGIHFYSISDEEKSFIEASLPQYAYEGVAYYASKVLGDGYRPLYRFYQLKKGFHFYTVDEAEKNRVRSTLPQYGFENAAYYVLDASYIAPKFRVPHTGISTAQCFNQDGVLSDCALPGVLSLNDQQDGHRSGIHPLSYSQLPRPEGGFYDRSECVLDNVTGLVWEGKTASGVRSNQRTSHFDNAALPQKLEGDRLVNPTQAEILALTNTVGYLNHVNSIGLCGYTDWRLPTVKELHSILHAGNGAGVDLGWFVNTDPYASYWAATLGSTPSRGRAVDGFGAREGMIRNGGEWPPNGVRLVRSAWSVSESSCPSQSTAERFTLNGAEATDNTTGLVWARCTAGKSWNGSTCVGEELPMTFLEALQYARAQTGWRLPNVKELMSVVDHGCAEPALDPAVFPNHGAYFTWSTTPLPLSNGNDAWTVNLANGTSQTENRTLLRRVQLVRAGP
jgi:hypothetical protein